ncbi:MAG: hypothetical protein ABIR96_07225 [Bdellovibrionota bacterium]
MNLPFSDPSWDSVMESWLRDTLDGDTKKKIFLRLASDSKFREDFCEWVKSLRSEGWATASQRKRIDS